jgi:hypothetical protein
MAEEKRPRYCARGWFCKKGRSVAAPSCPSSLGMRVVFVPRPFALHCRSRGPLPPESGYPIVVVPLPPGTASEAQCQLAAHQASSRGSKYFTGAVIDELFATNAPNVESSSAKRFHNASCITNVCRSYGYLSSPNWKLNFTHRT